MKNPSSRFDRMNAVPVEDSDQSTANAEIFLHLESPSAEQKLKIGEPILVRGLALADEPLKEVLVTLGDATAAAEIGQFRPELAARFPDIPRLAHAGFSCRMISNREPDAPAILRLKARTVAGRERAFDSPISFISPAGADSAAMRLNLDRVTIDRSGLLRAAGWVIAHARVEAVEFFVNGRSIGLAECSLERPDVASVWPEYEGALNAGFSFVADLSQETGDIQVIVVAQAAGGIRREYETRIARPQPAIVRNPSETLEFVCDAVSLLASGRIALSGWALSNAGIEQIDVYFEGERLGSAELGGIRPDVGNKYPRISGSRNSGYSFTGKVERNKLGREHVLDIELALRNEQKKVFKVAAAVQDDTEAATSATQEVLLFIDEPKLRDGAAEQPITAGLSIVGWALASEGIQSVSIEFDHVEVGAAYYGMRREDIAAAFPGYEHALLSGFAFTLPQRAIPDGRHIVTIKASSRAAQERRLEFTIEATSGVEPDGPWTLREKLGAVERLVADRLIKQIRHKSHFAIWLVCADAGIEAIVRTLRSIEGQIYRNFKVELIGLSASVDADRLARDFPQMTLGVSGNSINLSEATSGSPIDPELWVMPIGAGDVLSIDALFEIALFIDREPDSDLIYADERCLNIGSGRIEAFFKPDWSPDLLTSTNYFGRSWCARERVIGAPGSFDVRAISHYDLALRCSENAKHIKHIAKVLCERSASMESKRVEIAALKRALKRRGEKANVQQGRIPGTYRIRHTLVDDGLVSIIIPTCAARGLIKVCIESLRQRTDFKHFEIICIDNIPSQQTDWKAWLRDNADVVIDIPEPFNWSRFNNLAAREASGAYLLFLNDDVEIIDPGWLEPLLALATRCDVGVVGPQLLYPDRKVQHAGLFLSGPANARHAFRFCDENDPGYHGLAVTQRNVIAVTGACMLMRRSVFNELGGFDEAHSVVNNDLDFCLRAHAAKLLNIYTPFSRLIHHELASRAALKDDHDAAAFTDRWGLLTAKGDPFFHPHLSKNHDNYQFDVEPARIVFAGHPVYLTDEIKRIAAVKVDHIGDFLTAFPAFRRIKELFPSCTLFVLASPATKHLAALEPAIDCVIPFEFFHARSGLGQKELDEKQFSDLADTLRPLEIDIAIDLRKQPDTRPLLRYTGAKWTAGFDWRNQFSWMDIALTWDGDTKTAEKRQHVADDLVNLVDAVAAAGRSTRNFIQRSRAWSAMQFSIASRLARQGLYERPLVCIHPASGTEMRQWPPLYFARLADMLVEADNVNIAVIGGPDERDIAERMIANVSRKERVTSLVGVLQLAELPYFIDSCSLFVGNNSGPKHIAAALGVPTVGIHSGVVDPREWGPLGDVAAAVQRDMTCAPCYRAKREDCHRGLACLTELAPAAVLSISRKLLNASRGVCMEE